MVPSYNNKVQGGFAVITYLPFANTLRLLGVIS